MWEVRRHWGPLAVPGPHLRSGRAAGPGGAALYSPHLRFDVPAVAAQTLLFARRRDEEVTERRLGGNPRSLSRAGRPPLPPAAWAALGECWGAVAPSLPFPFSFLPRPRRDPLCALASPQAAVGAAAACLPGHGAGEWGK